MILKGFRYVPKKVNILIVCCWNNKNFLCLDQHTLTIQVPSITSWSVGLSVERLQRLIILFHHGNTMNAELLYYILLFSDPRNTLLSLSSCSIMTKNGYTITHGKYLTHNCLFGYKLLLKKQFLILETYWSLNDIGRRTLN